MPRRKQGGGPALAEYHRKRDFKRADEPRGSRGRRGAPEPAQALAARHPAGFLVDGEVVAFAAAVAREVGR